MIREILEQNGIVTKIRDVVCIPMCKQITITGKCEENGMFTCAYYVAKNSDSNFGLEEQACRQYVKENGFKLEWFDKQQLFLLDRAKEIYKDKRYSYDTWFKSYLMMNQDKLIAWLYANDIEVK